MIFYHNITILYIDKIHKNKCKCLVILRIEIYHSLAYNKITVKERTNERKMKKYTVLALTKYNTYDPKKHVFEVWANNQFEAMDKAQKYFEKNNIAFHHFAIK